MTYQLPNGPSPDLEVLVNAIYAEPLHELASVGQRLVEVTDGSGTALAIVKSGGLHIGVYDVIRHSVPNPVPVKEYGQAQRLEEMIAVFSAFRRLASGPIRRLLGELADAMGSKRAIIVVYDHGVVAVIPVDYSDVHKLVAIKLDGARTIAQERICVEVAKESRSTWELIWHAVQEHRRATEPVETEPYDALEAPSGGANPYAAARISEEDAIDGLEESWMSEDGEPDEEGEPAEPDEDQSIGPAAADIYDGDDEIRF